MTPIRVVLAGLSSTAKTSWAAEGHLPYLFSDNGKLKYQIVALLNSSTSAAEAAKNAFKLPASVKAYGSPQDVATDPDIDLLVVNTRVDVHYDVARPVLEAGKAVYIEWPLTEITQRADELAASARRTNAATLIGLQGRVSPVALKINSLLSGGCIGKVLSSNVQSFGNLGFRGAVSEGLSYFTERKVGGNPITIAFAHMSDLIHSVLGEYKQNSFHSHMQIQRPIQPVLASDGTVVKTVTSDVPDLLSVHGTLESSKTFVAPGASLFINYRSGPASFGAPAFVWTLNGEKGEIRVTTPAGPYLAINADSKIKVTSPSGPYLQSDSYRAPVVIEVQNFSDNDKIERVEWDFADWQNELPIRSRNVAELYERFAETWNNGGKAIAGRETPDFAAAVQRHEYLDRIFSMFDTAQ